MLTKRLIERTHQAYHLFRTLTFMGEYKLVQGFTKLFSPWVQPPSDTPEKEEKRNFILKDIQELYEADAKLFSEQGLPLSLLKPESPWQHLKRLPSVLLTAVKMSRQRKTNQTRPHQVADVPDYFHRNFHWQIDGYLTEASGEIYNHQVEILFTGTAQAMRRLVFFPLLDFLRSFSGKAQLLELAAGTGEISHAVATAFPQHSLTVSDLSQAYLQVAKRHLPGEVNIVQAAAENLPFKDSCFDVVYSVFLFHEIPTQIRQQVLQQAFRVLRPGGIFIMVDSIQAEEVPEYAWALEKFPQDYHEPFYKSYTDWNLTHALEEAGFENTQQRRGFFSKCVWAHKPKDV
jgi:SAM-dependent methyltransferase